MDPGPLGTLGVGVPYALAAKIAAPKKKFYYTVEMELSL